MSKLTISELFAREAERVVKLSNMPGKQLNKVSEREYKGFNKINLYLIAKEKGFKSNEWITFDQLTKSGLELKDQEHGTPIFNHKLIDKEDGKKEKQLRYYLVFNMEQVLENKIPDVVIHVAEAEKVF